MRYVQFVSLPLHGSELSPFHAASQRIVGQLVQAPAGSINDTAVPQKVWPEAKGTSVESGKGLALVASLVEDVNYCTVRVDYPEVLLAHMQKSGGPIEFPDFPSEYFNYDRAASVSFSFSDGPPYVCF